MRSACEHSVCGSDRGRSCIDSNEMETDRVNGIRRADSENSIISSVIDETWSSLAIEVATARRAHIRFAVIRFRFGAEEMHK